MMMNFSIELKQAVSEVDAVVLAQLPKVEGAQKTVLEPAASAFVRSCFCSAISSTETGGALHGIR